MAWPRGLGKCVGVEGVKLSQLNTKLPEGAESLLAKL